jgi:hypothetical protein
VDRAVDVASKKLWSGTLGSIVLGAGSCLFSAGSAPRRPTWSYIGRIATSLSDQRSRPTAPTRTPHGPSALASSESVKSRLATRIIGAFKFRKYQAGTPG